MEPGEARSPEPWGSGSARFASPPQEDGYEAALRAADALFSGARRPAEAEPGARPTSNDEGADETQGSHPAGGRVLRAMDEQPPEELLRLEAEFAPKRRGRKPGSKNKPKTLPVAAIEEPLAMPPAIASAPPALPVVARIAAVPAIPRVARAPVPRGDRYAWVRTKLKPGQAWKRRIPKIAW